jgi:hypothetical protein
VSAVLLLCAYEGWHGSGCHDKNCHAEGETRASVTGDNGTGHMYDSVAVSLPILSWLSALSYCVSFWRRCVRYTRSNAPIHTTPPQLGVQLLLSVLGCVGL